MRYQHPEVRLAPARKDAGRPFDEELAFIARRLRRSVHDLDARERQLLDDFGRGASRHGETRYRMLTLRALCAIARRSVKPEDRDALPELVRTEVREGPSRESIAQAFDEETGAVGPADVAQRAFEQRPDCITATRCRDALTRQLATTRAALDAVQAWLVTPVPKSNAGQGSLAAVNP